jgi:AraC-like DNA-binding protein
MISISSENPQLKGIIDFYYFHSLNEEGKFIEYSYFPNFKNALTIYNGSKVKFETSKATATPSKNDLTILYSTNYYSKIDVSIECPFDKIGIVFHPLGINHFLDKDIDRVHSGETRAFAEFGSEFHELLEEVFQKNDQNEKVKILDSYFAKKMKPFESPIIKAVELILEKRGNVKVSELAAELELSRKTLLRLFKRHLTCSVEDYRKMVKFRTAFNALQDQPITEKLTQIALESEYYDQADFTNQFKELTKSSPKKLKPKLKNFGDKGTVWAINW